jgi:hypothetical protein
MSERELLIRADSLLSLLWHRHVPADRRGDFELQRDVERTIQDLRTASKRAEAAPSRPQEPPAPLRALVEKWQAKEHALCRQADGQGQMQYAERLAAKADGFGTCADELEAALRVGPAPQRGESREEFERDRHGETGDNYRAQRGEPGEQP